MPRSYIQPRHFRRSDPGTLTPDQLRELELGNGFFHPFPQLADMQLAWETHREAMLSKWIAERAGQRPFACWLFDLVPQYGERRTTQHWTAEHQQHRTAWEVRGILQTHCQPPLQEFEHEYLLRHGQLLESELAAVGTLPIAADWKTWS